MTFISSPPPCLTQSLFGLLRTCKNIRNLQQVHAKIIRKGFEQDHFLVNQVIRLGNSLSRHLSYVTGVFDRVFQPNACLWNALIKGYCQHSSLAESVLVLKRMLRSLDVVPDEYTFPSLIKSCAVVLALSQGQSIHGLIIKYGTDTDVFVGSSLVDFYGKCSEIKFACKAFDEMHFKNEVSWTAMIVGYLNVGDLMEAYKLFVNMPKRNIVSWNAMIRGFVKAGDLKSAEMLFEQMPERNVVSFTTMIDGYAKLGDMASARLLFDQSPERDIVSWSALISGYAQNGKPDQAVKIFLEMCSSNVKPDEFIMVSLMSACSQVGCLELAKWVDSLMGLSSFDLARGHVLAALIDMNAKCGNMERATLLFEEMPKRDLISYCSMMQGLSIHGRGAEAVRLFARMLDEGLIPDDVAFTVILTACSGAGLVEEGCHYFDSMVNEYSLIPSPDHYACMVDLLGRSGKLKAAYELINSMPVEPHASAWGALLGACKLHCDIELGEEVAARLFELEPLNGGNFVSLSNIYAAADRWLDVSLLRSKMSERGVRKIPGCSWL